MNNTDNVSTRTILSQQHIPPQQPQQAESGNTRVAVWRSLFTRKVLDNNDSEARDHLSNERTLLSWMRTSMATAALGLVLARLKTISPASQEGAGAALPGSHSFNMTMGVFLLVLAILLMAMGTYRFAQVRAYIIVGKFPSSTIGILFVSGLLILTFAIAIILLLVVAT